MNPREAFAVHRRIERDGACGDLDDPNIMIASPGQTRAADQAVAAAKEVCAGCRVQELCLEWALATGQTGGTLGGLDEKEREQLTRAREVNEARLRAVPA